MGTRLRKRACVKIDAVRALSRAAGTSELVSELLISRGIATPEEAERFLHPGDSDFLDPCLMPDMRAAVSRIEDAIKKKERIVLYGDYDCDGVCSVAALYEYLKDKTESYYYIPDRKDGYGLSVKALERVAESIYPDLIITVDCGVTSVSETEYCKDELGIDIIITDHHMPAEVLPDALILNPKLGGYPNPLCGAGVVFKLIEALGGLDSAKKALELAAIATVGDIVPLTGENRAIVALGLRSINRYGGPSGKGLKRLLESLKLNNSVTASDIAFMIAPRLNAAGRMGSANRAVELLTSSDDFEIDALVKELNAFNLERQTVLNDIVDDVKEKLKAYDLKSKLCIVLADSRWDGGVLGIACSKIAGEFNRPTVLFSTFDSGAPEDGRLLKGSARSIPDIDLYSALAECRELFTAFGGHRQAAGLSLKAEELGSFTEKLNSALSKHDKNLFVPEIVYDAETQGIPDLEAVNEISAMEPFGEANPRPVFLFKTADMRMSRIKDTQHIRGGSDAVRIVAFNRYDDLALFNAPADKLAAFTAECCVYKNSRYVNAVVSDIVIQPAVNVLGRAALLESYLSAALRDVKGSGEIEGSFDNSVKSFEGRDIGRLIEQTDELYGTAFIAYSDVTAEAFFTEFLKSRKNLLFSFGRPENANPCNRLILSPNRARFDYYDRIVFLDKPLLGTEAALRFRPNRRLAEVYMNRDENPLDAELKGITGDGELRELYVRLRGFINGSRPESLRPRVLPELYKILYLDRAISYESFLVGFAILCELRTVEIADNFVLHISGDKRSLSDSSVYVRVNSK